MADELDVPKVGPVNKKVVIGVGAAAAAFIGWRYWQARQSAAADTTATDTTDPGFADPGSLPSVAGAVSGDNSYGSGGTTPPSTDDFGFSGTTNAQWSQYVLVQLQQSDVWSYTDIAAAIGAFLANKPLTNAQVQIVQAAVAVAGYPPEGPHTIIAAGTGTAITVAPTGLTGKALSSTSVSLAWNGVAGAASYEVYKSGTASVNVTANAATVTGLTANTSYSFAVAARTTTGSEGPKSSTITVKTSAAATTPPPGGTTKPPPVVHPVVNKYPKKRTTYVVVRNDNFTSIAQKEKTGLTGVELYNYQFTSQAGRSASAQATIRKRGKDLVYAGETVAIPYPK
jgi:hypothetical protein